jgi:DNA-directed RNA polymerase subunit RPC12/RpoP
MRSINQLFQYFCLACHTILGETATPIDLTNSEECPKCGSLLSETIQRVEQEQQQQHDINIRFPRFHKADSSRLNFDIMALDRILQFRVGESVCIMGVHSGILRDRLCVRSLLSERYGGFNSPNVIIIDAGNNSDVYQCVNFARQYGMDITSVLRRIIVSRPFTIYQLANLIIYELPKIVEKLDTRIIVISDLLHLFLQDPQTDVEESKYLIRQITESIRSFLNNLLVITTLQNTQCSPYERILFPKFNKRIEISNGLIVNIHSTNKRQHSIPIRIRQNDLSTIPNR